MSSVNATLLYANFPSVDGKKPYTDINGRTFFEALTGPLDLKERNFEYRQRTRNIINVPDTATEQDFSLDTTGFQYIKHPSSEKEFPDDEAALQGYYHESIELIKRVTGANRVVIFDHTIRRNKPGDLTEGPDNRHPVPLVHVDQTPQSAEARVKRHLPESDVSSLLSKRFQIVNFWRPIGHPAHDWPLALCDYRTTSPDDLVSVDLMYPHREPGETYQVQFNEKHQWYYKKGMTPEDVVLIKCFDSQQDGVARLTPHTAFEDPTTPPDAPLRTSIELRALVFYP